MFESVLMLLSFLELLRVAFRDLLEAVLCLSSSFVILDFSLEKSAEGRISEVVVLEFVKVEILDVILCRWNVESFPFGRIGRRA